MMFQDAANKHNMHLVVKLAWNMNLLLISGKIQSGKRSLEDKWGYFPLTINAIKNSKSVKQLSKL